MSYLSILVLLCCTVVCDSSHTRTISSASGDSGDSCKKFQLNKEHFNKRFSGPGLYEMSVPGHHDCVRNCFYLSQCKSTDYNKKAKICKINDVDSTQITTSDFEQKNGAIFSDITAWPPAMAGTCGLRPCSLRQRCIPDKNTYHCADILCSDRPTIKNGDIALDKINGNQYMDTATVTCDSGYLKSVDTIKCTASGDWEQATCDSGDCGKPESIANGKIVLNGGTTIQSKASVTCDAGYQGSVDTIWCTASGKWDTVSCVPISCDSDPSVEHGDIILVEPDKNKFLDKATVVCDATYVPSQTEVMCQASGEWEQAACKQRTDCKQIVEALPNAVSGVYDITLWQSGHILSVYCDMDTDGGGWTVFQRRFNGSVDFYRTFTEYENGFGTVDGEFWLGLKYVKELAEAGPVELRTDMSKVNGTEAYETFQDFSLNGPDYVLSIGSRVGTTVELRTDMSKVSGAEADETFQDFSLNGPDYVLSIGSRVGTTGDATYGLIYNNGLPFTAKDSSNANCANARFGGWWYGSCTWSNLNGRYYTPGSSNADMSGLTHYGFSVYESMLTSKMMLRRV